MEPKAQKQLSPSLPPEKSAPTQYLPHCRAVLGGFLAPLWQLAGGIWEVWGAGACQRIAFVLAGKSAAGLRAEQAICQRRIRDLELALDAERSHSAALAGLISKAEQRVSKFGLLLALRKP